MGSQTSDRRDAPMRRPESVFYKVSRSYADVLRSGGGGQEEPAYGDTEASERVTDFFGFAAEL